MHSRISTGTSMKEWVLLLPSSLVGLALGGYITNRIIKKRNFTWINVLMVFEGVIGFYALILPFIIHSLSSYSIAAEVGLTFLLVLQGY